MSRLTINLDDKIHQAPKETAVRQNRSIGSIIEESLKLRGIRSYDSAKDLVAKAIWREPVATADAPEPGDKHLRALLASQSDGPLVTGDPLLIENLPGKSSVLSARGYVDLFMNVHT